MEVLDLIYGAKPFLLVLALPPTLALMIAALGGWLAWRHRAVGIALLGVGLALTWISCSDRAGEFLSAHLVKPPPPLTEPEIGRLASDRVSGRRTVVLVLGGGLIDHAAEYGKRLDPNPLSMERLRYGVWLARRIGAPMAISGGRSPWRDPAAPAESEVESRVAQAEFGLVPRWVETRSRDTRENARFSVELLRRDGIERIVVVTHQMHLPRALRAFAMAVRDNGGTAAIDIVAAGIDARDQDVAFTWWDWTPSVHGFRKVRYAVTEWLGWIAGH